MISDLQGIQEYEPRVVKQLMDFVYRYISEVLQDAEVHPRRCTPITACKL